MRHIGIKDVFLPQPPSFGKKKAYEVHGILGTGTFGKVVVSGMPDQVCFGHEMNFGLIFAVWQSILDFLLSVVSLLLRRNDSEQHGMSLPSR